MYNRRGGRLGHGGVGVGEVRTIICVSFVVRPRWAFFPDRLNRKQFREDAMTSICGLDLPEEILWPTRNGFATQVARGHQGCGRFA